MKTILNGIAALKATKVNHLYSFSLTGPERFIK